MRKKYIKLLEETQEYTSKEEDKYRLKTMFQDQMI